MDERGRRHGYIPDEARPQNVPRTDFKLPSAIRFRQEQQAQRAAGFSPEPTVVFQRPGNS